MKITPEYAATVNSVAEQVLAYIQRHDDVPSARMELLADVHRFGALGGEFNVTAEGRCRWKGDTLAGAITEQVTGGWRPPIRVWHIKEDRTKTLVLLDDGEE